MNFTLEVDTTKFDGYMSAVKADLVANILGTGQLIATILESTIKRKLSGEVLNEITGKLKSSISVQFDGNDSGFTVIATQEAAIAPYGAIQEFGGKTAAHEIVAVKTKALRFLEGDEVIFARIVHHPGSLMPERSYMRSSLEEQTPSIISSLKDAVERSVRQ